MHASNATFTVRRATVDDAEAIRDVHIASIREVCGPHYSAEQIEQWVAGKMTLRDERPYREDAFYVAEVSDAIVGFGHLHLDTSQSSYAELGAVYVHPDQLGRGIGRVLFQSLEDAGRAAGLQTITTNSTLNAVPFYRRCGFTNETPDVFPFASGLKLECVRMEKRL